MTPEQESLPFSIQYSKIELAEMPKDDLVELYLKLQTHMLQATTKVVDKVEEKPKKTIKPPRKFDFSNVHYRRVLLNIMYFGWDYQGYVVQDNTTKTIEDELFAALTKACLIESRETSNYHRCGRTDKGVSSLGQVISISLRSKFPVSEQNLEGNLNEEIPYCKILNSLLPSDVKTISWLPLPDKLPLYSARFDCSRRSYKYYFPKSNFNIAAMREACNYLVGEHDFRNLCKIDAKNQKVYIRNIFSAQILPMHNNKLEDKYSFYYLYIVGSGFLWHQIRLIFSVLMLIGQGKESPYVIKELLDVEKLNGRPQFDMAWAHPLNLFECNYEVEKEINWIYDKSNLKSLISHLHSIWLKHSTAAVMTEDCISNLEVKYIEQQIYEDYKAEDLSSKGFADILLPGVQKKEYINLLKRPLCKGLDINREVKKRI